MQSLATVVFERTPEGAAQLSAGGALLPRALRAVLLAVDGRSSVARYEPFLTSLMPLDEKFVALEQLGLLRRAGQAAIPQPQPQPSHPGPAQKTAPVDPPDGAPVESAPVPAPDFEHELQALSQLTGLIADNAASVAAKRQPVTNEVTSELFAELAPSTSPRLVTRDVTATSASGDNLAALASLKAEMEAFLSQTLGMTALPVVIMVTQISSIAQLRQELPSYSQLMRSYDLGEVGEAHINSLQAQLARFD